MLNPFDLFLAAVGTDEQKDEHAGKIQASDFGGIHRLDEVDLAILKERQEELRKIEEDTLSISEIMNSLSSLLCEQGENLDLATEHVESSVTATSDAVISLDNALVWQSKMRGLLVDATTVLTGSGLGALGFIGGPVVGVPSLIAGLVTAASVIAIRRRLQSSELDIK